jgi:hypothetical protein
MQVRIHREVTQAIDEDGEMIMARGDVCKFGK